MKYKLDREERQIERDIDKFVPVSPKEKRRIDNILKKAAKDKIVTFRINSNDLSRIQKRAVDEGMPYQTLISSILHKYADNRLCDVDEVRKVLKRA